MKILIVSQVFWPDESAGSQILTDLAEALVENGFGVDVITSSSAYENQKTRFVRQEDYKGIRIRRLRTSFFGKGTKIGRLVNFFAFNLRLFLSLLFIGKRRYDAILSLSAPPLVAFFGILAAKMKKIPFIFWAMDLQPELAIVAGYVSKRGLLTRTLQAMSDVAYKRSELVIALDKDMAGHIRERGGQEDRIETIPVWPVVQDVYTGPRLENPFRLEHGFADKIVVMYSGNHSVIHPLDTLLNAALELRDDPRFLFVFIGGGVRKKDVTDFIGRHQPGNVVQLPHQPREKIHLSLSAADLHAVVLGDGCIGFTHPSKVYGIMAIGRPILYVGPNRSYVTDILDACPGNIAVEHGQHQLLTRELLAFAAGGPEQWQSIGRRNTQYLNDHLSKEKLTHRFVSRIRLLLQREPTSGS